MYQQLGHPEVQVLANWIFYGVYDFVSEVVGQAAALGFLGLKIPKKVKKSVVSWTSEEQRRSMPGSMTAESEQQLEVMRCAALSYEEKYYALRMARYPDARAEDIRLELSTAWAISRNEAAARAPLNLPYSRASPDEEGCRYVVSSDDELFDSDS